MLQNSKAKKFIANLLYAFIAQGLSLILSFLMSLVVPQVLGVKEFGYWQLFLFYSGYVGFFHFGLNDGVYLRYGGIPYHKLDYPVLGSQFWASLGAQSVIAAAVSMYSLFFISDPSRRYVLILTAIYLLINNGSGFLWYVFQMTNLTKIYSVSVMINKIFYFIAVLFLLAFRESHFEIFVILYVISQMLSLIYCGTIGRKLIFSHLTSLRLTVREMRINISVGINLMFSNIADMLILGIGRFMIDMQWGIAAFGKFSFALSLTTFFLMFISQVSMVLFPALRQTDGSRLQQFYKFGRDFLGIILAGVFLAYMPIKFLLGLWLPQYQESLKYLSLLLPLCTFDGKMQMLCSTYLKVLRKERVLLFLNLMTLTLSLILSVIGGYVIHNIYAIIIFMVAVIAFRSIISEIYLSKLMGITVIRSIVTECLLVVVFMTSTWFISPLWGFVVYFIVYSTYLYFSRKKIANIFHTARSLLAPSPES